MTNKEAIKRLQSWLDSGYYSLNKQTMNWEDDKRALDLAIKALEERPQMIGCFNCEYDNKTIKEEPCKYCVRHDKWRHNK